MNNQQSFGEMLRNIRQLHKISQMELGFRLDVSTKHLSFIETGRSKPSRNLILKIAQALNVPYRRRNALLIAAGYPPEFKKEPFDGEEMSAVREGLELLLENHNPYPGLVVNAEYQIMLTNTGYDQLVAFFAGEHILQKYNNAVQLLFEPDGLRPYVQNWALKEYFVLTRLRDEALSTQNGVLSDLYEKYAARRSSEDLPELHKSQNVPIMNLVLEKEGKQAAFYSILSVMGTPLDVTTQELYIELLFPADAETKEMFPLEKS